MSNGQLFTTKEYILGSSGVMQLWLCFKRVLHLLETHGKYIQRECYVILQFLQANLEEELKRGR